MATSFRSFKGERNLDGQCPALQFARAFGGEEATEKALLLCDGWHKTMDLFAQRPTHTHTHTHTHMSLERRGMDLMDGC